jgi:membrane protease YdiL (CAAX protease family)
MVRLQGTFARLLVLLGFCLVGGALFSLLGIFLLAQLKGLSSTELLSMISSFPDSETVNTFKWLQLFNTVGIFIVPGLLFAYFFMERPLKQLFLRSAVRGSWLLWVVVLFLCAIPFLNLLVSWNENLSLPDGWDAIELWMREAEAKAERITRAFLHMEGPGDLLFNILLIGILPAFGEELIFRGILQPTLHKGSGNPHLAIWISAVLFSAIHFQFFGFFPRLFLGAFFGYLLLWTRNLWVPIFAHFLNNTSALLLAYFIGIDRLESEFDQIGTGSESWWLGVASLLLFIVLLMVFRKSIKKAPQTDRGASL